MAALTITVHMCGRRRFAWLCRLAHLLLFLHRYHAAAWVIRRLGIWMKVDAGKHPQWRWQNMGVTMTPSPKVVQDG